MAEEMGLMRGALTCILVFTFLMAGANKVSDQIHPETHQFLSQGFVVYGRNYWHHHLRTVVHASKQEEFLPMLELLLLDDSSGSYQTFMKNIGFIEIFAAAMMLLGGAADKMASLVLFLLMVGATAMHYSLGEMDKLVPTAVLATLVVMRMSMPGQPAKNKAKQQ